MDPGLTIDSDGYVLDAQGKMIKLVLEDEEETIANIVSAEGDCLANDQADCVIVKHECGKANGTEKNISRLTEIYNEMTKLDSELPPSSDEFEPAIPMRSPKKKGGRPKVISPSV